MDSSDVCYCYFQVVNMEVVLVNVYHSSFESLEYEFNE